MKRKRKRKRSGWIWESFKGKQLKGDEDISEEVGASAVPEQGEKAYSILTSQRVYQTVQDIHQNLVADAQE